MARLTISTVQLSTLEQAARRFVRTARRLALAAVASVFVIALLLWRDDGFDAPDAILTLLLLTPPVIVFLFTRGVLEVVALPGRMQRVPGQSQEQLAELTRIAGDAHTARPRNVPLLLWRLRGTTGSLRNVVGIALPFKVFTPAFLTATALAALGCLILVGFGLIALVVLAVG